MQSGKLRLPLIRPRGHTTMTDLEIALNRAKALDQDFEYAIRRAYPNADRWTWFRADEAVRNGTADDHDRRMANDASIVTAWERYIDASRAFYLLRDGPLGTLGRHGI